MSNTTTGVSIIEIGKALSTVLSKQGKVEFEQLDIIDTELNPKLEDIAHHIDVAGHFMGTEMDRLQILEGLAYGIGSAAFIGGAAAMIPGGFGFSIAASVPKQILLCVLNSALFGCAVAKAAYTLEEGKAESYLTRENSFTKILEGYSDQDTNNLSSMTSANEAVSAGADGVFRAGMVGILRG